MHYKRFKEFRRKKGISQEEVAKKLNITQTQYSRYERGAGEMPFYLAIAFAKNFNCELDYLAEITNYSKAFNINWIDYLDPAFDPEEEKRAIAKKQPILDQEEAENLKKEISDTEEKIIELKIRKKILQYLDSLSKEELLKIVNSIPD